MSTHYPLVTPNDPQEVSTNLFGQNLVGFFLDTGEGGQNVVHPVYGDSLGGSAAASSFAAPVSGEYKGQAVTADNLYDLSSTANSISANINIAGYSTSEQDPVVTAESASVPTIRVSQRQVIQLTHHNTKSSKRRKRRQIKAKVVASKAKASARPKGKMSMINRASEDFEVSVSNISPDVSNDIAKRILEFCGSVVNWNRALSDCGTFDSYGLCTFKDGDSAWRAIRMLNGREIAGQKLSVSLDPQMHLRLINHINLQRRGRRATLPPESRIPGPEEHMKSYDSHVDSSISSFLSSVFSARIEATKLLPFCGVCETDHDWNESCNILLKPEESLRQPIEDTSHSQPPDATSGLPPLAQRLLSRLKDKSKPNVEILPVAPPAPVSPLSKALHAIDPSLIASIIGPETQGIIPPLQENAPSTSLWANVGPPPRSPVHNAYVVNDSVIPSVSSNEAYCQPEPSSQSSDFDPLETVLELLHKQEVEKVAEAPLSSTSNIVKAHLIQELMASRRRAREAEQQQQQLASLVSKAKEEQEKFDRMAKGVQKATLIPKRDLEAWPDMVEMMEQAESVDLGEEAKTFAKLRNKKFDSGPSGALGLPGLSDRFHFDDGKVWPPELVHILKAHGNAVGLGEIGPQAGVNRPSPPSGPSWSYSRAEQWAHKKRGAAPFNPRRGIGAIRSRGRGRGNFVSRYRPHFANLNSPVEDLTRSPEKTDDTAANAIRDNFPDKGSESDRNRSRSHHRQSISRQQGSSSSRHQRSNSRHRESNSRHRENNSRRQPRSPRDTRSGSRLRENSSGDKRSSSRHGQSGPGHRRRSPRREQSGTSGDQSRHRREQGSPGHHRGSSRRERSRSPHQKNRSRRRSKSRSHRDSPRHGFKQQSSPLRGGSSHVGRTSSSGQVYQDNDMERSLNFPEDTRSPEGFRGRNRGRNSGRYCERINLSESEIATVMASLPPDTLQRIWDYNIPVEAVLRNKAVLDAHIAGLDISIQGSAEAAADDLYSAFRRFARNRHQDKGHTTDAPPSLLSVDLPAEDVGPVADFNETGMPNSIDDMRLFGIVDREGQQLLPLFGAKASMPGKPRGGYHSRNYRSSYAGDRKSGNNWNDCGRQGGSSVQEDRYWRRSREPEDVRYRGRGGSKEMKRDAGASDGHSSRGANGHHWSQPSPGRAAR